MSECLTESDATPGETYYRANGWSGCAGSDWYTLTQATRDGWEAAAREATRADRAEAMHAAAFRIGIAKQDQIGRLEVLLDQTEMVAREQQHLARLSTREVRAALTTPPGASS